MAALTGGVLVDADHPRRGHHWLGQRNRLKRLQYRPHILDGFIAGTGLTLHDPDELKSVIA